MSLSYLTESEAPRDFRVSSTDSDGHYTKCVLCYTVKRNFYCPECIRAGNFVHSSMPYSDRFAEKQAKLLRLKANRHHVLDRCEKLILPKIKRNTLLMEAKRAKDKINLLRLAIEQRRSSIDSRRQELVELTQHNHELMLKMPRYQKRVSHVASAARGGGEAAAGRGGRAAALGAALARLRRARVRQLVAYIFPLHVTYDASDSLESEFVVCSLEPQPPAATPPRGPSLPAKLHILSTWMYVTGDYDHIPDDMGSKELEAVPPAVARGAAALGLAAQLVALLGHALQERGSGGSGGSGGGGALQLGEWYGGGGAGGPRAAALRARLGARAAALAVRAGLGGAPLRQGGAARLLAVPALCAAASADMDCIGRVEGWLDESVLSEWEETAEEEEIEPEPPEHLSWPETYQHEPTPAAAPPPGPAPSLVTSAAASIVSMWRGWTK